MPLLDHFHPPLHGPRRREGFHHAWATVIAQHLNRAVLPADYFAEPGIGVGPELEIDVATLELLHPESAGTETATAVWSPPRPKITAKMDLARLDSYEIRVYQDLGGAELRAAIEFISPASKDRAESRRTFAAQCAGYLRHRIAVVIVDIVTARTANLHAELFDTLGMKSRRRLWRSSTGPYAVAYNFDNFEGRVRSEGLRAFGGVVLITIGVLLMNIGAKGWAGSGVVLDPDRARKDVEPWSRMGGGVLNDAL